MELDNAGIAHTIHEYDRGDDLHDFGREAADALGLDHDQVFKTLVVVADDELVVAVVPVSCQLSMKRVAAAVGAKKATMCDPARAERSSGYIVGGISPIGQRKRLRTVTEASEAWTSRWPPPTSSLSSTPPSPRSRPEGTRRQTRSAGWMAHQRLDASDASPGRGMGGGESGPPTDRPKPRASRE